MDWELRVGVLVCLLKVEPWGSLAVRWYRAYGVRQCALGVTCEGRQADIHQQGGSFGCLAWPFLVLVNQWWPV